MNIYKPLIQLSLMSLLIISCPTQSFSTSSPNNNAFNWDWRARGTDNGHEPNPAFALTTNAFPKNFYFGAGSAAIQSENLTQDGIRHTYNHLSVRNQYPDLNGHGQVNDEWNKWAETLQLIKDLNLNAYRTSLEWARVQPTPDQFDENALDEYARRFAQLIDNNVTPFIDFHHYSDPQWFMYPNHDSQPVGFENLKQSKQFVRYCVKAFEHINHACQQALLRKQPHEREKLHPRFLTFCAPNSYSISGYQQGTRPPQVKSIARTMHVLENMCKTHDQIYHAIKKIDPSALVGTSHNIYHIDVLTPKKITQLPVYLLSKLIAAFGDWMSNSAGLRFFTDKNIPVTNPLKLLNGYWNRLTFTQKDKTLDFIAINYYCHGYMRLAQVTAPQDELKTANARYTIYAEGLYRAIKNAYNLVARPLGIPIYIIENGFSENNIPDERDTSKIINGDERRNLFLNRHLYALSQAYQDGYPIAGYFYWSLYDNCEWADGYKINFGLADRNRNIKKSGHHYARLINPFTQN